MTGKIVSLDRALEPGLPAFLALLDVPVGDPQWEALDPPQRRQRTLEALKRLLLRESQVQPLGLALEDLHWIDSETQALLDSLVDSLPMARLLLLVNYRPEYQHGWGSRSYYTQLRIDPLPPESCEELLQGLLGPDPSVEPLKQPLIARTQGNPFFLEESIRTLVETHVLEGDRGAYRLVKAPTSVQVPATVQAVLAARIDRLPLEEKRLLQAAAVIGEEVPFSLLQAIGDRPDDELHRGLAHLQSAEFLDERASSRSSSTRSSTPSHTRSPTGAWFTTAGGPCTPGSSKRSRRCTPGVSRSRSSGSPTTRFAASCGRKPSRTSTRRAVGLSHGRRTVRRSPATRKRSLRWHISRKRPRHSSRRSISVSAFASRFSAGRGRSRARHLREAEPVARALDDQRRLGLISAYMSEHSRLTGHSADAVASARKVEAIAKTLGDLPLTVAANYYLATAYFAAGDQRRAGEFFAKTIAPLDGDLGRERFGMAGFPVVMGRVFWAWARPSGASSMKG